MRQKNQPRWIEALERRQLLSAGDLDAGFGVGGVTDLPTSSGITRDAALLNTNQLLIAGSKSGTATLTRLNANGQPDTTFGSSGTLLLTALGNATPQQIVLSPDGRIAILARLTSSSVIKMLMLKSDGDVDTGFGTNGLMTLGSNECRIGFDSSGRFLLAKTSPQLNNKTDIQVARYSSSGQLDTTYGVNFAFVYDSGGNDVLRDLVVEPNGRATLLVGVTTQFGASDRLVRVTPAGLADASFTTAPLPYRRVIGNIALDSAGGVILAVGEDTIPLALSRVESTGSVDTAFGHNGRARVEMNYNTNTIVNLVIDGQGKLLIRATNATVLSPATGTIVSRFTPTGDVDPTFGSFGTSLVPNLPSWSFYGYSGRSILTKATGEVVVLGATDATTPSIAKLAQLEGGATANTTLPPIYQNQANTIVFHGDAGDDIVSLNLNADKTSLIANMNTASASFDPATVAAVIFDLKGGEDAATFDLNIRINAWIDGGNELTHTFYDANGVRTAFSVYDFSTRTSAEKGAMIFSAFAGPIDLTLIGSPANDRFSVFVNTSSVIKTVNANGLAGLDVFKTNLAGKLEGGEGDDRFYVNNNAANELIGGDGFDAAATDQLDTLASIENGSSVSLVLRVFEDVDGDGVFEADEPFFYSATPMVIGLSDATELEFGYNRQDIPGETAGRYQGMIPGIYTVDLRLPFEYLPITALDGHLLVDLRNATGETVINFAVAKVANISGIAFEDLNGDGVQQAGEALIAGRQIFADSNGNDELDAGESSTASDTNGFFFLGNLLPGAVKVRQVLPAGWASEQPIVVPVKSGQNVKRSLPSTRPGDGAIIGGRIVLAAADSPGVQGQSAYLDLNDNGKLDDAEPSATSDASGFFRLTNLSAGTYQLRFLRSQNYWQETPINRGAISVTIGSSGKGESIFAVSNAAPTATVKGSFFNDKNFNGIKDAGEPAAAAVVIYADLDNDKRRGSYEPYAMTDAGGMFEFNVNEGSRILRVADANIWSRSSLPNGVAIDLIAGDVKTLAFLPAQVMSLLKGSLYFDSNRNGKRDADELAQPSLAKVYVDLNNSGAHDSGEPSDTNSNFAIYDLAPGTYYLRTKLPSGYFAVNPSPGAALKVTLGKGQTLDSFAIGVGANLAKISGSLFRDSNADGVFSGSVESLLSGWTVYLDKNLNGKLDSGESSTTTNSRGGYVFSNLKPGTYQARVNPKSGWRRTFMSSNGAPQKLSDVGEGSFDFGYTQRALLSGNVFNDVNGNKLKDSGEKSLGGWTIFLDTDGDGKLDSNERSALTDASGNWSFTDLVAGTYKVRIVQKTGYKPTTPTGGLTTITLASGQTKTGVMFGERKI